MVKSSGNPACSQYRRKPRWLKVLGTGERAACRGCVLGRKMDLSLKAGVQGARESRCITSAFPLCEQRSDAHTCQREEEMDEGLHAHHGEEEKDGGTSTSKATLPAAKLRLSC